MSQTPFGMPPEIAANLIRVCPEVKHRVYALNYWLEPRVIWEMKGET